MDDGRLIINIYYGRLFDNFIILPLFINIYNHNLIWTVVYNPIFIYFSNSLILWELGRTVNLVQLLKILERKTGYTLTMQ
jgi:hypothetical protein